MNIKTKAGEYVSSKVWEIDYLADSDVHDAFEAGALWALGEIESLVNDVTQSHVDTPEYFYVAIENLKAIIQKIRGS